MPRRLFSFAAAVSLLGCGLTIIVWARSHLIEDDFEFQSDVDAKLVQWFVQIDWSKGELEFQRVDVVGLDRCYADFAAFHFDQVMPRRWGIRTVGTGPQWNGFMYWHDVPHWDPPAFWTQGCLAFPLWVPALATAVLPARWVWVRSGERTRQRAGGCPQCGYDLRATPERCPECGLKSAS